MLDKEIDVEAAVFTTLSRGELCATAASLLWDDDGEMMALVDRGDLTPVHPKSALAALLPKDPGEDAIREAVLEWWTGEEIVIDGWAILAVITRGEWRYGGGDGYVTSRDTVRNAVARATARDYNVVFRSRWIHNSAEYPILLVVMSKAIEA